MFVILFVITGVTYIIVLVPEKASWLTLINLQNDFLNRVVHCVCYSVCMLLLYIMLVFVRVDSELGEAAGRVQIGMFTTSAAIVGPGEQCEGGST